MADYKPNHPNTYPSGWHTALRGLLQTRAAEHPVWTTVDWTGSFAAATNRMRKLRAFRKGLEIYPGTVRGLDEALAEGFELAFRREQIGTTWAIQMGLTKPGLGDLVNVVNEVLSREK